MRALSIQDLQSDQQDILEKVTANDPRFKMMPSLFGPNFIFQTPEGTPQIEDIPRDPVDAGLEVL
jgi:hypothetical protein